MKTSITFEIDSAILTHYTDEYLASLWHIAQANPAEYGDITACDIAEEIGREIIRRWLSDTPPSLWNHEGRHIADVTTRALVETPAGREEMPASLSAQCLSTARPRDGITDDPYNACSSNRA